MTNEIKTSIVLSLFFHAGILLFFSLHAKRPDFIVLPVELMFSNPPSAAAALPDVPAPAARAPLTTPGEKDVIVPKKEPKKEKQKATVRKETVQDAKKGRDENRDPGPANAGPSGASGPLSVDAARFPYAYYTNIIVKKIGRSWQWSTDFGRLKTVVYFKIQRSGEVSRVDIKKGSGDRIYDEQAVRAIKLSSPFPPLPAGYDGDDLGVYFEFTYHE